MKLFVLLMTVSLATLIWANDVTTCHKNNCDVLAKIETEGYERRKFDNNLKSGHTALKKVMSDLKIDVDVEEAMPLETYGIRYQNLIHQEDKKMDEEALSKLKSFVKMVVQSEYITMDQIVTDMGKEMNAKINDISDKIEASTLMIADTMERSLKLFESRITRGIDNEIFFLTRKMNDVKELEKSGKEIQDKLIEKIEHLVTIKLKDLPIKCDDGNVKLKRIVTNQLLRDQKISDEINNIQSLSKPSDCLDVLNNGKRESGLYKIYPRGEEVSVYCDMVTDGGGWTIFLMRQKQAKQENFTRNWQEYKDGFGHPTGEHWMGNDALHRMTSVKKYSMRTDLTWVKASKNDWGEWKEFQVDSEDNKYKLTIGGYNSDSTLANNGFAYNDGEYFTTWDRDNDSGSKGINCAVKNGQGGGFWYHNCSKFYPTRFYNHWGFHFTAYVRATEVVMKLRPI